MATLPSKKNIADPRGPEVVNLRAPDMTGIFGTGQGTQALAQGIGQVGASLSDFAAEMARRQKEDDAAAVLRADAMSQINKMRYVRELQDKDPKYATWGNTAAPQFKKFDDDAVSGIKDPRAKEELRIKLELDSARHIESLQGEADKRRANANKSVVLTAHDTALSRFYDADSPEEQIAALNDADTYRQSGVASGILSPAEDRSLRNERQKAVKAWAEANRKADPEKFLRDTENVERVQDIVSEVEGTTDADAGAHGFASGYDVPLGFGAYGLPPKPLTEMTLKEAYDFGRSMWPAQTAAGIPRNKLSSALGKYQIVGDTLVDVMDEAGLTWGDAFNEENQDKLFAVILQKQGFGAWQGFSKHPEALPRAEAALSRPAGIYDYMDAGDRLNERVAAQEDLTKPGSLHEANKRFALGPTQLPLNPLDANEKKRMDAVADSEGWAQAIMRQDWETFDNKIVPWVATWGAIPDGVKGAIEAGLRSSDPKKVAGALQAMDGLQRANPRAFTSPGGMATDDIELMERYRIDRNYTQSDEEIGQKVIDERADPTKQQANEALRKAGEKEALKHAPWVRGLFYDSPSLVGDRPEVTSAVGGVASMFGGDYPKALEATDQAALQQDYVRLYALAFEKTNDHAKARAMSRQALLKRWSVSNVSGAPRIMRNAPETFNPQGLDAKWQNAQARMRLGPLIGDSPFILESDDRTDMEIAQGKTPTWIVMVPASMGGK